MPASSHDAAPAPDRPTLTDYLCEALDQWRRSAPDLTVGEVRDALDELKGLFERVAPSAEIISLSAERAMRAEDSSQWSVKDALAETLRLVSENEDEFEMVYIAMLRDGDHKWLCAGGHKLDYLGLLTRHIHIINNN